MSILEKIYEYIAFVDYFVLEKMHELALNTGEWMTSLMKIISALGNKGICVFVAALFLMIGSKNRKTGICIFGAVSCGTIIGNGILKYGLARIRPYNSLMTEIYEWWQYVGASMKDSPSFPSGHVMAIAAGTCAVYLLHKRKAYIGAFWSLSLLMGVSRCYLMVHWFTDVIGGMIVGIVSAGISYKITEKIYEMPQLQRLLNMEIKLKRSKTEDGCYNH